MQGGYFLCKWLDLHVEIGMRAEDSRCLEKGKFEEQRRGNQSMPRYRYKKDHKRGLNSRVHVNRAFNRVIFNNALIQIKIIV